MEGFVRAGWWIVIAALLAVAPAAAQAQPKKRDDAAERKKREQEAIAHYQEGQKHYNLGEFDEAIAEYKAAYDLTSAPGLLFNIAQAYRLKRDPSKALFFYRTYLREDPNAENRADVELLIEQLEREAAGTAPPKVDPPKVDPPKVDPPKVEKNDPTVAATTTKPEVKEVPLRPDQKDDVVIRADRVVVEGGGQRDVEPSRRYPGRTKKILGLAAMGTGLALGGLGLWFGKKAQDNSDAISKLSDDRGMWSADWESTYSDGQTFETVSILTLTIGAGALAGGIVLYYLGFIEDRAAERALEVGVVPVKDGAGVGVSWTW
jgi:tetratricopeptide (TPR) repeat protein